MVAGHSETRWMFFFSFFFFYHASSKVPEGVTFLRHPGRFWVSVPHSMSHCTRLGECGGAERLESAGVNRGDLPLGKPAPLGSAPPVSRPFHQRGAPRGSAYLSLVQDIFIRSVSAQQGSYLDPGKSRLTRSSLGGETLRLCNFGFARLNSKPTQSTLIHF